MSIDTCILKLKEQQLLTEKQEQAVKLQANRLENIYRDTGKYPESEVRARAEQAALDEMTADIQRKQTNILREKGIIETHSAKITASKDPHIAMRSLLVAKDNGTISLEHIYKAIEGKATGKLFEFMETFRSKVPGGFDSMTRASKTKSENLVRAMFDEDVPKEYGQFAKAYKEGRQEILKNIEAAGVKINLLEDWAVAQKLDNFKVAGTTKEQFVKDLIPALDDKKMRGADGNRLTPEQIKELSEKYYDELKSESKTGKIKRIVGSTANADAELHRIFHYKNADAYLSIFNKYGEGNVFDNMFGQLQTLSTDAALVTQFGPNPERAFKALNKITKDHETKQGIGRGTLDWFADNERIFNMAAGKLEGRPSPRVASITSGATALTTSIFLGKAMISSLMDTANMHAVASIWGISHTKLLGKEFASHFYLPYNKAQRHTAKRLHQVQDVGFDVSGALNRYADLLVLGSMTKGLNRTADVMLRATLLNYLTQSRKSVMYNAIMQEIGERTKQAWFDVPETFKQALAAHSITEADFSAMGKTYKEIDGVRYVDVDKLSDELHTKLVGAVNHEVRVGIPEPSLETKAITTSGAAPGTQQRAVMSILSNFQGFTLSMSLLQHARLMLHPANTGKWNKQKYIAKFLTFNLMAGMASLALVDFVTGKSQRDWTDPLFMLEAIGRSGIFGLQTLMDTIIPQKDGSMQPSYGTNSVMPPFFRLLFDASTAVKQSVADLANPKKDLKEAAYPLIKFTGKNIPMDTWYTETLIKKYITDELLNWSDHKRFTRSMKATNRALKKRTGQEYIYNK